MSERENARDEFGRLQEIVHVSANPKYGSEKKGAPTEYFLVVAPERIRVNCDLRHVNVVLCCDPKAFTHTNPLDGMTEGGAFVWESDETPEAAWLRIPRKHRQQILDKKIRVFILPGFDDRAPRDRPPRPAAAHAGQRVSRRVLPRVAASSTSSASSATTSASRSRTSTGRSSAASATRWSPPTWR